MTAEQSLRLWRLFKVGREFEEVVIKKLLQILPVKAFQRPLENKDLQIAGVLDVLLESDEPIEIKSCNKYSFQEISKYSGNPKQLINAELLYRKYYFQVQTYLFLLDVEKGFLFVKDRESGNEMLIEIVRDEEAIKEVMEKAQGVNECLEKEKLPEGIFIKDICNHCYFYRDICQKELKGKKSQVVELSEGFLEKLEQYYILKDQMKEYERLEKEVKETLKEWEDGVYVVKGRPFKISVTEYSKMYLNLPEELKKDLEKQYGELRTYKRVEIK
jgi:hypothetical protein